MKSNANRVDEDIKALNYQFLIIVRECARQYPLEAMWKFGLNETDIEKLSAMSITEVQAFSACSRSVFTVVPTVVTAPAHVTPSILAALQPVKANFEMVNP